MASLLLLASLDVDLHLFLFWLFRGIRRDGRRLVPYVAPLYLVCTVGIPSFPRHLFLFSLPAIFVLLVTAGSMTCLDSFCVGSHVCLHIPSLVCIPNPRHIFICQHRYHGLY